MNNLPKVVTQLFSRGLFLLAHPAFIIFVFISTAAHTCVVCIHCLNTTGVLSYLLLRSIVSEEFYCVHVALCPSWGSDIYIIHKW